MSAIDAREPESATMEGFFSLTGMGSYADAAERRST